jgi:hypothetical protein
VWGKKGVEGRGMGEGVEKGEGVRTGGVGIDHNLINI